MRVRLANSPGGNLWSSWSSAVRSAGSTTGGGGSVAEETAAAAGAVTGAVEEEEVVVVVVVVVVETAEVAVRLGWSSLLTAEAEASTMGP